MSSEGEPTEEALDTVRALCGGEVSFRTDGWRRLIFMERLRFRSQGQLREMDGVLVLNHDNASYPTKLYLAENVGNGLNWNETAYILGRNWHTFSWANVPSSLSIIDILGSHLSAITMERAA